MSVEHRKLLRKITEHYQTGPLTPELVTDLWQIFIKNKSEGSNDKIPEITVPPCDRTQKQLDALTRKGRGMVYNPNLPYSVLMEIFPRLKKSWWLTNEELVDKYSRVGWVDIEMDANAPYRGTTDQELEEHFASQRTVGQRLSTYVWASHANQALTGHYFDELSFSRLPGTFDPLMQAGHHLKRNDMMIATFGSSGDLHLGCFDFYVYEVTRGSVYLPSEPFVGGRSEGFKKAA